MKSVGYYTKGGTETLVEIELPTPQPGPRDLLVSVRAVSVNPVDVKRRRWEEPADGSTHRILGYDAACVVASVGPEVTLFVEFSILWPSISTFCHSIRPPDC